MNFMVNETAQKLRGGYYTPLDLATFLAAWVKEIAPKRLLEPSCGDGAFFTALSTVSGFKRTSVLGFELDPAEAAKASSRASELGLGNVEIRSEDFLGWAVEQLWRHGDQFDGILGNPPFIRYQYLPEKFQGVAEEIFKQLRLPFTKHTNAWVPFVAASLALLRPGGRLAMVVPAEIIHITHAQSLRSYLGSQCSKIVIVDPEDLWFPGTLQGAVLLLAEKLQNEREKPQGVGIFPVRGLEFTHTHPSDIFHAPRAINGKTVKGKWTRALLDVRTRALFDALAEHPKVHRFDEIAKVDVGIVTGANKFFLVPDAVVHEKHLERWTYPMFGRSEHCPGIIYDARQHQINVEKGNPTNFLWFHEDAHTKVDQAARAYIREGEAQKLDQRFKCRVRTPWYTVPSVYSTEIGMLKRSHDTPRLILNELRAYTTDTAYRIRTKDVNVARLVGSFVNPLTALSAELEGRHYGGGVLELIPSEIEQLIIPLPDNVHIDLRELDELVRTRQTCDFLWTQGERILTNLGLTKTDRVRIIDGWRALRDRRHRTSSERVTESDG